MWKTPIRTPPVSLSEIINEEIAWKIEHSDTGNEHNSTMESGAESLLVEDTDYLLACQLQQNEFDNYCPQKVNHQPAFAKVKLAQALSFDELHRGVLPKEASEEDDFLHHVSITSPVSNSLRSQLKKEQTHQNRIRGNVCDKSTRYRMRLLFTS